jgi:hypothetical protein
MQAINLEHYAQGDYRAPVTSDSSHLDMMWTGALQSTSRIDEDILEIHERAEKKTKYESIPRQQCRAKESGRCTARERTALPAGGRYRSCDLDVRTGQEMHLL